MKKLGLILATILAFNQISYAGLITHSDYASGATITASAQNTNENAIVNEFNGNIESSNIKDATIVTGDISASAGILHTQLSTTAQSTFTYVNTLGAYRRPVLQYVSATTIDVEANTGTANQTCIQFPDERRCVTENTALTSVNRRFIITEAASFSGTKNSGLRSGYVETLNTWYSFYAVKASDVSTDFVVVGDTLAPTQANYASLNTAYGSNSWVYLGVVPNGDKAAATLNIVSFTMAGNLVTFSNVADTNSGVTTPGVRLATTAGATTLTFTYAAGFNLGTPAIPANVLIGDIFVGQASSSILQVTNSAATANLHLLNLSAATQLGVRISSVNLGTGVKATANGSTGQDIFLQSYVDGVLGVGYNPQL